MRRFCFRHLAGALEDLRPHGRMAGGYTYHRDHVVHEAILNPEGKIWLDQGWCIGSAGIAWGIVRFQGDITQFFLAAPTLLCCLIGGALAGLTIWAMRSCGNRLSKEEEAV